MDPVLSEIYSTVMPAAPFVIGAYALIWVALGAYVLIVNSQIQKARKQLALLEDLIAKR